MRAIDGILAVKNSVNIGQFNLPYGGQYAVGVSATFGGGNVELQILGPDGSTFISIYQFFNNAGAEADLIIGKFLANGMKVFYLPAGQYKFVVTTATAVYANVIRVPGE
jgi:hypothetical protein